MIDRSHSSSVEIRVGEEPARFFTTRVVVLGRDPACDVVIDDPSVSRRHCEVRIGEYGASIADCDSSNGTYYEAGRIGAMLLTPGRVYHVRLGHPDGAAIGISTNVPLSGPANRTSQAWAIDAFAFDQGVVRADATERPVREAPAALVDGAVPTITLELFVIGVPAEHRTLKLRKASIRIGRSHKNDIVLPELAEDTSGIHAELRWDGHQLWVVDLESTNGTYVEDERIDWRPLSPRGRSTIRLGHSGTGIVVAYTPPHVGAAEPRTRPPRPPPPSSTSRQRRDTSIGPPPASIAISRASTPTPPEETRAVDLGELADRGAASTIERAVDRAAQWYPSGRSRAPVEVGVIGVAGTGKSSLLNALLAPGCQLLPAGGVGSLTAVPIHVRFSSEARLRVVYRPRSWLLDILRSIGSPKGVADNVLGALSLMCTGDQHGTRDPEWLLLALRHALNPDVGRPPDETLETRAALARLSALLAAKASHRVWIASENAPDFFFALREHTAGQMSPLCASIELGWPSPLLAAGASIVDLPGLASIHDAHASTTAAWLSTANAVLVVCDRAGLTEAVVATLRRSGFVARWAEGAANLLIGVTKLDLSADDEVRTHPGRSWRDAFDAVSGRAIELLGSQLARAFPEAAARAAATSICPVSARELQRLAEEDPENVALLSSPEEAGFTQLDEAVFRMGTAKADQAPGIGSKRSKVPAVAATAPWPVITETRQEPSKVELDSMDAVIAQWETWIERTGRPFFERWEKSRVDVLEQLIADVRALASPGRRELPICLLGSAGIGKSTLINALIDPHTMLVPQGGVGPLTAQATVVRFAKQPYMRATYHGAQRLNQLVFALDRYCERQLRASRQDENEIDAASRQEALLAVVQGEDVAGSERQAVEERVGSYVSQARQMIRGNQYGDNAIDEVAYLTDALRAALGRAPVWGRIPDDADMARIQLLRETVAVGDEGRHLHAGGDRPAFLREVRLHATGSISPLIKSLEVGWDSELLKDGVALVDLPGVGVANDEYRSVTSDWIRRATAVLLVVDRAGVTEPAAELLRTTGFMNALLHRAPDAKEVAPLLWVVSVKLDDAAGDDRKGFAQQHPDVKLPPWQSFFDDTCAKTRVLVRNQLDREFATMSGGEDVRDAWEQANRSVLEHLQVHPVSAIEYRKFFAEDDEDRAKIKEAGQSNMPTLISALQTIAVRHAADINQRVDALLAELSAAATRGLSAVLDNLEQGDRDQARLARLREQLAEVLAPRTKELAQRQGQLRERLRGTVPKTIESEVARAVQAAAPAVATYLKGIERVHFATLRAAVRKGGVRVGNRPLDIPNELALRIEGPLAVIWNKAVVKAVSDALGAFARDLERILDEVLAWAQSGEAGLDATRVARYKDDVVLRIKQLGGITDTAAESLRSDVKQRLHETVQETIRTECQAFVDSGRDIGSGVKNRVLTFLGEAGNVARVQAGTTAEKYLLETYDRVVTGIGTEFASVSNALADVETVFVGHVQTTNPEDLARARDEARNVRALLETLPSAATRREA